MSAELIIFTVLFFVAIVLPSLFILLEVRRYRKKRERMDVYLKMVTGRKTDHLD